jgi:hypothetical protein
MATKFATIKQQAGGDKPLAGVSVSELDQGILGGLAALDGKPKPRPVHLSEVVVDWDIQVRQERLDEDHVVGMVATLSSGGDLPEVTLYRVDGRLLLVDGFHRYEAHKRAGKASIKAVVIDGSRDEAIAAAEDANLDNAKMLSSQDKQIIFKRRWERDYALKDGRQWRELSAQEIARHLRISPSTASTWIVRLIGTDQSARRVVGKDGRFYDTTKIAQANQDTKKKQENPPVKASAAPDGSVFLQGSGRIPAQGVTLRTEEVSEEECEAVLDERGVPYEDRGRVVVGIADGQYMVVWRDGGKVWTPGSQPETMPQPQPREVPPATQQKGDYVSSQDSPETISAEDRRLYRIGWEIHGRLDVAAIQALQNLIAISNTRGISTVYYTGAEQMEKLGKDLYMLMEFLLNADLSVSHIRELMKKLEWMIDNDQPYGEEWDSNVAPVE